MLIETALAPLPRAAKPPAEPKRRRAKKRQLLVLPSARTAEGRRLREFRAALIAHCGGSPSFTQLVLIDRATVLQHHLTRLDRKAAADGDMSEHAQRRYLAWDGSLRRALLALGLQAAPPPRPAPPSVADILAGIHRRQAEAEARELAS